MKRNFSLLPHFAWVVLFFASFIFCNQANAAVTKVGASSQNSLTNTLTYTAPAGANRLLVVTASDAYATNITNVTFNGITMTRAKLVTDGFAVDAIYVLALGTSASSTTANVVISSNTTSGNLGKAISATTFIDVDQASPVGDTTSTFGTSLSSTRVVASTANDMVFDLFDSFIPTTGGSGNTPNASQTPNTNTGSVALTGIDYTGFGYYSTSTKAGSSSVTMAWSTTNHTAFIHLVVNIRGTVTCVAPTITTAPSNTAVCVNGNAAFSVAATNATGYQWQVNTGSGFANVTNGGVYTGATSTTLSITGATAAMNGYIYRCDVNNGGVSCATNSGTATLTVSNPSISFQAQTNVPCFGGNSGAACVNAATGGTTPYTYNWTPGNPTGDGTTCVSGLTAGTWTCTVTDAIGCTKELVFNVISPSSINFTQLSQTNVSCNGLSNGAACMLAATGGAPSFTYNWTPGNPVGDGTTCVAGLASGAWTCTATDANGCTKSFTVSITQPAIISTIVVDTICSGTTYSFNSQSLASSGTYLDTLVSAAGCDSFITLNLFVRTAPVVNVTASATSLCDGDSATLNFAGTFTNISFSPTTGINIATAKAYPNVTTTYTITGTDDNGCSSTTTLPITVFPQPSIGNIAASPSTLCSGDTSLLTIVDSGNLVAPLIGGNSHRGNMFDLTPSKNITITGFDGAMNYVGSGTYSIYYKLGSHVGFEQNAGAWTLLVNSIPITGVNGGFSMLTNSLNLPLTAGTTYAFYLTNTNVAQSNKYHSGTAVGAVSATNADLTVYQGKGQEYPFGTFFSPRVWEGRIHYNYTGSSFTSASINPNSNTIVLNANNIQAYPASNTTYTITGTAAGGCTATKSVSLVVIQPVTASIVDTICANASYTFNGQTITSSGAYNDTLVSSTGCDSILTLNLYVKPLPAAVNLNGWNYALPITVNENNGTLDLNYSLKIAVNTQSLISAGQMNSNGDDIRFVRSTGSTNYLSYWIESGINTSNTIIWVKVDSLLPSTTNTMYMLYGNTGAAAASSAINTFNNGTPTVNSATDSVVVGGAGGVSNSQRGFRFSPNEDVLLVAMGRREPNGTTRYITLFDVATQAILKQDQVSGPAGSYSYQNTSPMWLMQGTQYLLELYQGASDGYYFGSSSQIGQHLTYYDMKYCNSCTQNTYPTTTLNNYHYGFPDFWYLTKNTTPVAATYSLGQAFSSATTTVFPSNILCEGTAAILHNNALASISWNNGVIDSVAFVPTATAQYIVTITANGCSAYDTVDITVLQKSYYTIMDSICAGTVYAFNGNSLSTSGTYYDTLTASNGCDSIITLQLFIKDVPTITSISNDTAICDGATIHLSVAASNNLILGTQDLGNHLLMPLSIVGNVNTIYAKVTIGQAGTVTHLKLNNTNGDQTSRLCNMALLSDAAGVPGTLLGTTATSVVPAIGVNSFALSTAVPVMPGTYWVAYSDDMAAAMLPIAVNSGPFSINSFEQSSVVSTPSGFVSNPTTTGGGSFLYMVGLQMDISDSTTYTWMPSTGIVNNNGSNIDIMPTTSTIYTVQASNSLGCSTSSSVAVAVNANPTITAMVSKSPLCSNEFFSITGSGADTFYYTCSGPLFNPVIGVPYYAAINNAGIYTVTGTNSNGCSNTGTVEVVINAMPQLQISSSNMYVCALPVNIFAGAQADSFTWYMNGVAVSAGQSDVYSTAQPGYYNVVANNFGCIADTNGTGITISSGTPPTEHFRFDSTVCENDNSFYIYNTDTTCSITQVGFANYWDYYGSNFYHYQTFSYTGNSYGVPTQDSIVFNSGNDNSGNYAEKIISNQINAYTTVHFDWYWVSNDTVNVQYDFPIMSASSGPPITTFNYNSTASTQSGSASYTAANGTTISFGVGTFNNMDGGATLIITNFWVEECPTNNAVDYYTDSLLTNYYDGTTNGETEIFTGDFSAGANTLWAVVTPKNGGCSAQFPINFTINAIPDVFAVSVYPITTNTINPAAICAYDSAQFVVDYVGGQYVTWGHNLAHGDTAIFGTISNIYYSVNVADTITGCNTSYYFGGDIQNLTYPSITGNLNASSSTVCTGDSITVFYDGPEPVTFTNGYTNGDTIQLNSSTEFIAMVQDPSNGCKEPLYETVIADFRPKIDSVTLSDASICDGDTYTITAHASNNIETYTESTLPYTILPTSTTPTYLVKDSNATTPMAETGLDDGVFDAITLPFAFQFYGQWYSKAYISTNGSISFDLREYDNDDYDAEVLPNTNDRHAVINFANTDLNFNRYGAHMEYYIEGAAPNRMFVLNYDAPTYSEPFLTHIKGQVVLYEGSNHIQISVDTISSAALDGSNVTIGVQNQLQDKGFCLTGAPCSDDANDYYNKTWHLAPQKSFSNYTWIDSASNATLATAADTIVVAATASNKYIVDVSDASTCTSADSISVQVNPNPTVMAYASDSMVCLSTSVMLYGTGAATYSWSGGVVDSTYFAPSSAGTSNYTVTGIDAAGCSNTSTIDITVNTGNGELALAMATNSTSFAGGSSMNQVQPDGSFLNYVDINCNLIASVNDGAGGNVLGSTTAFVTVNATTPTWNTQPYAPRWYDIVPTNQGAATVTIYLTQDDFDDYNAYAGANGWPLLPTNGSNTDPNIPNIRITKVSGGTLGTGTPTVITPSALWDATNNYWALTFPVASFSQFFVHTVNAGNAPLSIHQLQLQGNVVGNTDAINLSTTATTEAISYTMYYSTDGSAYAAQKTFDAVNNATSYSHVNATTTVGKNYYYAVGQYKDGSTAKSNTVVLIHTADGSTVSLHPNPATNSTTLAYNAVKDGAVTIKVTDATGKLVKQIETFTTKGSNEIVIDIASFAAGVYQVQLLNTTGKIAVKQLVKTN